MKPWAREKMILHEWTAARENNCELELARLWDLRPHGVAPTVTPRACRPDDGARACEPTKHAKAQACACTVTGSVHSVKRDQEGRVVTDGSHAPQPAGERVLTWQTRGLILCITQLTSMVPL